MFYCGVTALKRNVPPHFLSGYQLCEIHVSYIFFKNTGGKCTTSK